MAVQTCVWGAKLETSLTQFLSMSTTLLLYQVHSSTNVQARAICNELIHTETEFYTC